MKIKKQGCLIWNWLVRERAEQNRGSQPMLQSQGVLRLVGQRSPPGPNWNWQQTSEQKPLAALCSDEGGQWYRVSNSVPRLCSAVKPMRSRESVQGVLATPGSPATLPGLLHLWAYFPVRKSQHTLGFWGWGFSNGLWGRKQTLTLVLLSGSIDLHSSTQLGRESKAQGWPGSLTSFPNC